MENKQNRPKLLTEFAAPTYEQWLELVEQQLKGAPFEKKLVTQSTEGLAIQPIYQRQDGLDSSLPLPGEFPFIRGTNASGLISRGWEVSQQYLYAEPSEWNQAVLYDLSNGLTSISLTLDEAGKAGLDPDQAKKGQVGNQGLSVHNKADLARAFAGMDLSQTSLMVHPGEAILPFFSLLMAYCSEHNIAKKDLQGAMVVDPLAILASNGDLKRSSNQIYDEVASCTRWAASENLGIKTIGIDLGPYAESGANAAQELALAMAGAVETLREMQTRDLSLDLTASNICFFVTVGSDFFKNIAKLRALRGLWARVVSACGGTASSQKTTLHVNTLRYNKTVTDPYVNLLRATTEAYSGILGGCDSLAVAPFDEPFGLPDEFSRRVSRNIQYILKEECQGSKVIDPAGGSWFVEQLTDQLAEKAWLLFQEIEKQGGLRQTLQNGFVQESIKATAAKREVETAQRKNIIVGTNMFPNLEEEMLPSRLPDYEALFKKRSTEATQHKKELGEALEANKTLGNDPSAEAVTKAIQLAEKGLTLGLLNAALQQKTTNLQVKPLNIHRVSGEYEQLREKAQQYKQKHGTFPPVFLANMGPVSQHKARADFAAAFLQPGGFLVLGEQSFDSVEAAAQATLESQAKIVVICSTDNTYPDLVPPFVKEVKLANPDITVAIAGYPKEQVDSFREAGVDAFIHLKANNLQCLKTFQDKAGV